MMTGASRMMSRTRNMTLEQDARTLVDYACINDGFRAKLQLL